MTLLHDLFDQQQQSPWLDNLKRGWITSGELQEWVDKGVRGITSNPSIFQKAIGGSDAYDDQFGELVQGGATIEDSYWELVNSDIEAALAILRPIYDSSNGLDGFVSVEVDPRLARNTEGTITAARELHTRIDEPNLYVKIPGTAEGLPAIQQMISEGRSINVTLLFSLGRYAEVMEAYIAGLEACEGDLSKISSVASFFISRTETAVDNALDAIGTPEALALKGVTATAQGHAAYKLFLETFSGPRWDALVARGAQVQRPLWASTSTKNADYPDTAYIDRLIGPNTVNTIPDGTLVAFLDHGTVARTIDADLDGAVQALADVAAVGVDLDAISQTLETEGVASFEKDFGQLLGVLGDKAETLR